jgi:PIN domain nuclease of toxin-antitoxin system
VISVLLDTHVFLWLQTTPERLSEDVLALLRHSETSVYLSAASSWELAIKQASGKIALPVEAARYVPARMQASGVLGLPITHAHALAAGALPMHHRDPFDRMLVAQSTLEAMSIVTADAAIAAYGAAFIAAR